LKRLPELRRTIDEAHSVMDLWIDRTTRFEDAYRTPRNDDLIARIYAFSAWCLGAPRNADAGRDPCTAAMVAFDEHIPKTKAAREEMPRWFTVNEVAKSRSLFGYFLDDEKFDELLAHMRRNASQFVPWREQARKRYAS
jgi:hypothetical protein